MKIIITFKEKGKLKPEDENQKLSVILRVYLIISYWHLKYLKKKKLRQANCWGNR